MTARSALVARLTSSCDIQEAFSLVSAESDTADFAEVCAELLANGIISAGQLSLLLKMHVETSMSTQPVATIAEGSSPKIAIIGCANGLPNVDEEIDGLAALC